jgi:copper chaperone CopZ
MKFLFVLLVSFFSLTSNAQVSAITIQASGLTCSMCSKAVKSALDKVSFVKEVRVNIKEQSFTVRLKDSSKFDLDVLRKAVTDAGFSVARMDVTLQVNEVVKKDAHVKLGAGMFHFVNASGQKLSGAVKVQVVDKAFTTAKQFKAVSAMTSMKCVQTGKMESCCSTASPASNRVYHVLI